MQDFRILLPVTGHFDARKVSNNPGNLKKLNICPIKQIQELLESRIWFQIDSDWTKHVVEKVDKNWLHFFYLEINEELSEILNGY